MKESKLTELIRGLTLAEFRKFGDYVNSPFANKSQKIAQLYNLVYNNFDVFDSNVISRKNIDYYFNAISFKGIILNHEGKNLDLNLDKKLNEMADYADAWFIVTKLKILNAILSRKFEPLSVSKSKLWAIDQIVEFIERNLS